MTVAVFLATSVSMTSPAKADPTPAPTEAPEKAWSYSASAFTYIVPHGADYVQPTVTADRDWLHLEARYNYEALNTSSAWIGYNFSAGTKVSLEVTPMIGGVFGATNGVAPGLEFTLDWKKLELYSESEYVFDTGNSSNSFAYDWSTLTLAPLDRLRVGLVAQRTRVYRTNRDIQRGVLVGYASKRVNLTAYVINPDEDKPTLVFAIGMSF